MFESTPFSERHQEAIKPREKEGRKPNLNSTKYGKLGFKDGYDIHHFIAAPEDV